MFDASGRLSRSTCLRSFRQETEKWRVRESHFRGGGLYVIVVRRESDYSARDDCLPARFVERVSLGRQPASPSRLLAAARHVATSDR